MKKITLFATIIVFFVATGLILQSFTGKSLKIEGKNVDISAFTELNVEVPFDVFFTQAESATLKIDADNAVLEMIEIKQTGKKLTIGIKDNNYKNTKSGAAKIYISTAALEAVNVAGSGNFSTSNAITNIGKFSVSVAGSGNVNANIQSNSFEGDIAGSGNVNMKGQAQTLNFSIAGSGNFNSEGLLIEDAIVDIAGSGSMHINASNSIEATVAGSGDVIYSGSPKSVKKNVAGSGKVKENKI